MRACLLVLSVLSSLIPLSGRESSLLSMSGHHGEAYRLRLPREARSQGPQKLRVVQQPTNGEIKKPFPQQPKVQLLDENDQPFNGTQLGGKPWEVEASGENRATLNGTRVVAANKDGLASFKDLTLESPVTDYHITFRLYNGSTNITTKSDGFAVAVSNYKLELGAVNVNYLSYDKRLVSLETEIIIKNLTNSEIADLQGKNWTYTVDLRFNNSKSNLKLNETMLDRTFNSSPFKLKNLLLTGWVYEEQLRVSTWPVDRPEIKTQLIKITQPFNTVRPPTAEIRLRSLRHVLSVRVNVTGDEARAAVHDDVEWGFMNEFGIMNGSQLWANCKLHAIEKPKIEWEIHGKMKDVKQIATLMYNNSKRSATFSFSQDKEKWALFPQTMTFKGKPFWGEDSPPAEPAFTIGGILYSHVLLGIVIAVMILPVCYLCLTWKRHERLIQERYQERLQLNAHPPPPKDKKPKKSKKAAAVTTEQPTINSEADRSNNGQVNNAPPFYIDTAPPPADFLPGHVFNAQDEWKMAAASAPLYPSFNPTGDGLPPPRFRWSAPEKTEMMELTMTQLKQQHRDFMEQTSGGGGNLSFSRYSSSGGDPFCLDDVESTQAAFQEVSFHPPSSVRLIPPATAPRPSPPEAREQLARNLKERAPQKTLSAPTIPTLSTHSQTNKTAVSKIVVAPVIDTCPLPGGVATEPTHTRPIRQTSLPEPQ